MLKEAIAVLQQKTTLEAAPFVPHISMPTEMYIPEEYIPQEQLRMEVYQEISALKTLEEIKACRATLQDRFGAVPTSVINLLQVMRLKHLCVPVGVEKIEVGEKGILLCFYNNTFAKSQALVAFIRRNPNLIKLRADQKLFFKYTWADDGAIFKGVGGILKTLASL